MLPVLLWLVTHQVNFNQEPFLKKNLISSFSIQFVWSFRSSNEISIWILVLHSKILIFFLYQTLVAMNCVFYDLPTLHWRKSMMSGFVSQRLQILFYNLMMIMHHHDSFSNTPALSKLWKINQCWGEIQFLSHLVWH